MDAFDADVLIYAIEPHNKLRHRILGVIPQEPLTIEDPPAGIGSVLLLPELLAKPMRDKAEDQTEALLEVLGRLELHVDRPIANAATTLAAKYRLNAVDATHLATAVVMAADRFITNNQKDFQKTISEVDVVYPAELPEVS
jgi:predicted nucleic acid-binding protein